MTKKDIIALDAANNGSIILYREGLFWRAYERSSKQAAIEPVVDPRKADHRLGRNIHKGLFGGFINVMLAAAAFNFKRIMRLLLRLVERVITWRSERQEQNTLRQSIPQVLMKNAMSYF